MWFILRNPKLPRWPTDSFVVVLPMVGLWFIPLEPALNLCSIFCFLNHPGTYLVWILKHDKTTQVEIIILGCNTKPFLSLLTAGCMSWPTGLRVCGANFLQSRWGPSGTTDQRPTPQTPKFHLARVVAIKSQTFPNHCFGNACGRSSKAAKNNAEYQQENLVPQTCGFHIACVPQIKLEPLRVHCSTINTSDPRISSWMFAAMKLETFRNHGSAKQNTSKRT